MCDTWIAARESAEERTIIAALIDFYIADAYEGCRKMKAVCVIRIITIVQVRVILKAVCVIRIITMSR